jgi:hypothetical protein
MRRCAALAIRSAFIAVLACWPLRAMAARNHLDSAIRPLVIHNVAAANGAVADPASGHTFVVNSGELTVVATATGIVEHTISIPEAGLGLTKFILDTRQRRLIALASEASSFGNAWAVTIDTVSGTAIRTQRLIAGPCFGTLDAQRSRLAIFCTPFSKSLPAAKGVLIQPNALRALSGLLAYTSRERLAWRPHLRSIHGGQW